MEICRTIEEMREKVKQFSRKGEVGFVPTMGYLHDGHLSLAKRARQENDFVVMSIFVNPTQFGEGEDYEEYPRNLKRDSSLAEKAGVDLIFYPGVKEIYPDGYSTFVEVKGLTDCLCGASRPGHFRGVTTVVTKLLNIVCPHRAYFGQKDAQQALVIRRMVRDLNINTEIITCPIVREKDGLALSSRNTYLSPREREVAPLLYRALCRGRKMIEDGVRDRVKVEEEIKEFLSQEPLIKIDYIEVRDAENLLHPKTLAGKIIIAGAVFLGNTRLIDNIILEV